MHDRHLKLEIAYVIYFQMYRRTMTDIVMSRRVSRIKRVPNGVNLLLTFNYFFKSYSCERKFKDIVSDVKFQALSEFAVC